jgi:DNA-binding response OmpR family regulator
VLVIEPDRDVGELLARTLREQGYGVRLATDVARAVAECDDGRPDVVLLEPLLLPWASGLALCRRIRRRSPAPVILLTTRTLEADVREGLTAGAADYIRKPFSPRDVLARLEAVLARRHGPPRPRDA